MLDTSGVWLPALGGFVMDLLQDLHFVCSLDQTSRVAAMQLDEKKRLGSFVEAYEARV